MGKFMQTGVVGNQAAMSESIASNELDNTPRAMAYVVSQYPMLSMIFIIREVVQLRKLGFRIDVASINAADRGQEGLTDTEAAEAAQTYYVIPHGLMGALKGHVSTLFTNPAGYLRGWRKAIQLAGLDLRALIYNSAYLTEALMIGVWMRSRKQQHLHAHLGSQAATIALFVREVFHFSYSVTVHGPDEFYDAHRQYLRQKVIESHFICCISYFARSQLAKLSPYEHWHKLQVSRLGVDPSVFQPRGFNPNPEVFEIICVGRLCSAKGQHILVDAVQQLVEQSRPLRLRIVGDGEDRDSLERHVHALGLGQVIIFEGAVNQDRIRDLYSRADIFSIPSFAEGIPVVLMEAMSMEIPCVTTRITGIPELIRDGIDGLLVAPSDIAGLAAALARLMDDATLREQLGKAARLRVIEHYNLEKNVHRLAEVFRAQLPLDAWSEHAVESG